MEAINKKVRYPILDEIRGFAVLCMIIYHGLYTLYYIFEQGWAGRLLHFFTPVEPIFAMVFVGLCGFCTIFSRSTLKRGLLLAGAAVLVTVVTLLLTLVGIQEVILFGILFLLASGTLLYTVFKKWIDKIHPTVGIFVAAFLFLITFFIGKGYVGLFYFFKLPAELYNTGYLAFLGFPGPEFVSSDYFPLLPWIFIFFFGVFASKMLCVDQTLPAKYAKSRCKPLAFLGQKALWIYLLHQPVIFGLAWLIFAIL